MSKFKVGDKVRNVSDTWKGLTLQTVYTVAGLRDSTGVPCIRLSEIAGAYPQHWRYESSFELVKEGAPHTFKKGDKVRCIRNDDHYQRHLTIGRVYEVTDVNDLCIYLVGDLGSVSGPFANRFEFVESAPSPEYLLHGAGRVFSSLEEVEYYVKTYGVSGETAIITQVVKRVKVSRVTTTTLEAV